MRDINLEDTIYTKFTTRAFATGIPTTLAGTPVLSIYEENNLTQITAGVSVTVDYDSVTGLNQATIVATAANGYEAGKSYDLVITTGTVGGVSVVGEVVASFTIEDSAAATDLANTTDGLGALSSQISALAAAPGVGARPFVPTTITVTSGSGASGTAADMANDDSDIYSVNDSAGTLTLDLDYQLEPGMTAIQYVATLAAQGVSDDLTLQFYDQVGLAYDTIDTITGGAVLGYDAFDKVIVGKYTTDDGLFQVRITGTGLTSATLSINKAVCFAVPQAAGITNGSTITLSSATTNQNLIGRAWNLALGSQDISGTYIFQAISITGTATVGNATPFIIQESGGINATTSAYGFFENSSIVSYTATSTALGAADDINIYNCKSGVTGAGAVPFDFSAVTKTTNIQNRDWFGGATYTLTSNCVMSHNGTGGTLTVTTNGADVELRGSPKAVVLTTSAGGTTNIIVWSNCPITISGTGGTVNVYGIYSTVTTSGATGGTINLYGKHGTVGASGGATVTDNGESYAQLVDDIYDEPESGHNVGGSFGKGFRQTKEGTISVESTVNDASATTITFITALTEATDDHYIDVSLVFIDGALVGQSRPVLSYNGTTKAVTLGEALTEAPANGDGFIIKTDHVHTIAGIQAGLATEAKQDIIDANIDSLQLGIIYGAAVTGTLSTTQATSDLTGYADSQLIGRVIIWTSGPAEGEGTDITAYTSAGGLLTFTALTTPPVNGDTFKIV
jgi:hypothetical protein